MHVYYLNQLSAIRRTVADVGYSEQLLTDQLIPQFMFAEQTSTTLDSERFIILLEDGSNFVLEATPLADTFLVSE